ncbi:hypothetical protein GJ744_005753 [Endocarpon pusillum]|uniref:Benzoate 4-monooxygenase n=1 Tax=Endocarpon pusillum TaxID=364733 RepID=A0A8H7AKQ1_9EURO|nr:hypothetical protein GJ744_005753 [Endocarpon pusillum]
MYQCRRGRRYKTVDDVHKRLGPVVRIQPNHVSIADPDAIQSVYGHGNGFTKSEYYDAFLLVRPGLFSTRDRNEHSRKRKIVSHTFSAKSIGQFERYIHGNLELFEKKWNGICETQADSQTGYASIDALDYCHYLAFDIIGDLAFGAPFGMLEKGRDEAEVQKLPNSEITPVPAVEVLNRRGELSGTLGCLPQLIPYARYLPDPFFSKGVKAWGNLAGIAVARVEARLQNPDTGRVDLLARLMEGQDEKGEKLGRQELTAEAITQLAAGSDTTSNTSCALLYWVLTTPGVVENLQKELDAAIEPGVPSFNQIKELKYLNNVFQETLRIHSTVSLGLPRLTPIAAPGQPSPPPVEILGHKFPPGTSLSVTSYTIHHSKSIWGDDADEFVPDRWDRITERQKNSFIPFSYGPRACIGRNVAEMEIACIAATVFRNFEFQMQQDGPLEKREGHLRKPLGLKVGIRRRENAKA